MPTSPRFQRQRWCLGRASDAKVAIASRRSTQARCGDQTMKLSRRKFLHVTAAGPALVTASMARAQAYPSRPITMIVPFPPGGLTDVLGRVLAAEMQMVLGQSVVVENVGGADGSIGTGRVARAVPD